jgi:hypothetical protein
MKNFFMHEFADVEVKNKKSHEARIRDKLFQHPYAKFQNLADKFAQTREQKFQQNDVFLNSQEMHKKSKH